MKFKVGDKVRINRKHSCIDTGYKDLKDKIFTVSKLCKIDQYDWELEEITASHANMWRESELEFVETNKLKVGDVVKLKNCFLDRKNQKFIIDKISKEGIISISNLPGDKYLESGCWWSETELEIIENNDVFMKMEENKMELKDMNTANIKEGIYLAKKEKATAEIEFAKKQYTAYIDAIDREQRLIKAAESQIKFLKEQYPQFSK